MISVSDAKKLIQENGNPTRVEKLPLLNAVGNILAEDIFSPIDTPPFDQSAMDGYAFSFENWNEGSQLLVKKEIQAGSFSKDILDPNEAVRIFTGAPVPKGADTVVMQEKVLYNGSHIFIKDPSLKKGVNVRLRGSQTKKDALVLKTGTLMHPAAISLVASMGISQIKVFSKPRISIIVTGNELVKPGKKIAKGKIFESNSFGLIAGLSQLNISPVSVTMVDDIEKNIVNEIESQLQSDIIILTGGVSVGNYDFVASALEKCGVKLAFHKVKQKPGKPLYFGKKENTLVFGLPGNPAAVLTCFYQYIVPAISSFTKQSYFSNLKLSLAHEYNKKPGLTHFLKGRTSNSSVEILDGQESYLMNSFALADCLVELDEEKELFKKGDSVMVMMIV